MYMHVRVGLTPHSCDIHDLLYLNFIWYVQPARLTMDNVQDVIGGGGGSEALIRIYYMLGAFHQLKSSLLTSTATKTASQNHFCMC